MIIVKDLFKDDKKLISYFRSVPYGKNCVTEKMKNKKVKKEILASLTSSRPWHQVVSINSWRKDVFIIKKVASRCPASTQSSQDVTYTTNCA